MLVLFIEFLLHFTGKFNILFLPPLHLFLNICLFLSWLKQIIELLRPFILKLDSIGYNLLGLLCFHLSFGVRVLVIEGLNPSDDIHHFPSRYFLESVNYLLRLFRKILKDLYHLLDDNL